MGVYLLNSSKVGLSMDITFFYLYKKYILFISSTIFQKKKFKIDRTQNADMKKAHLYIYYYLIKVLANHVY